MIDPSQFSRSLCAVAGLVVANNQQVIAAVSGKRIRVLGWLLQATTAAAATITFKSASGGLLISTLLTIPAGTTGNSFFLPIYENGYFETITGQGLFADITGTTVAANVYYSVYVP